MAHNLYTFTQNVMFGRPTGIATNHVTKGQGVLQQRIVIDVSTSQWQHDNRQEHSDNFRTQLARIKIVRFFDKPFVLRLSLLFVN